MSLSVEGGKPRIEKCMCAKEESKDMLLHISEFLKEILTRVHGCVSVDISMSKSVSVDDKKQSHDEYMYCPDAYGYLKLTIFGENDLLFEMDIRDNILKDSMITSYHAKNIIDFVNRYIVKEMKMGKD